MGWMTRYEIDERYTARDFDLPTRGIISLLSILFREPEKIESSTERMLTIFFFFSRIYRESDDMMLSFVHKERAKSAKRYESSG